MSSRPITVIRNSKVPFVPASHEDPQEPGALKKVLVNRDHGIAGSLCMVNWARIEMGNQFRPHYHEDMTEVFILISGDAEISGDDYNEQVSEGDCIVVPPHTTHTMKNIGSSALEYIVFGLASGSEGKTVVIED
jgi:mannose-6-phosphate isomerase-like protein (cupin superfamily)